MMNLPRQKMSKQQKFSTVTDGWCNSLMFKPRSWNVEMLKRSSSLACCSSIPVSGIRTHDFQHFSFLKFFRILPSNRVLMNPDLWDTLYNSGV
jgi:hypothetical protein